MAWLVVTREVALLVWEDLEGQKRPFEITKERGVSERTVQRLGTAINGFRNHRPDGEVMMATGWSRQRISELKGYWREDWSPGLAVGGPQPSELTRSLKKTLQDWVQLEDVKDLLLGLKMELEPLLSNFPTVWKGFHPDHSNRLQWVGEDDSRTIVWNLEVEQDYRWSPVAEDLQILLPGIARDLQEIKDSIASYCQILVEEENRYLELAEGEMLRIGEVNLNRSHYFRSIIAEIDRQDSMPSEQDYRLDLSPKRGRYSTLRGRTLRWALRDTDSLQIRSLLLVDGKTLFFSRPLATMEVTLSTRRLYSGLLSRTKGTGRYRQGDSRAAGRAARVASIAASGG